VTTSAVTGRMQMRSLGVVEMASTIIGGFRKVETERDTYRTAPVHLSQ
jgi:hypothetical protein